MKREPKFETEAALCTDFIAWAKPQGWTAYAETEGWDILLVGIDGTQIGVQAKLKWNMKVLLQTIPDRSEGYYPDCRGPDFRAVLLPFHDRAADEICECLGLRTIWPGSRGEFVPTLGGDQWSNYHAWHYWSPEKRHELPEYVPDVIAGASGPVQLTKWKVAALRIAAVMELRGHVTRQDFKRYGIDPRRWLSGENDWLVGGDAPGQFKKGPTMNFDKQHPGVYAQVLEDVRKDLGTIDGTELRLTA